MARMGADLAADVRRQWSEISPRSPIRVHLCDPRLRALPQLLSEYGQGGRCRLCPRMVYLAHKRRTIRVLFIVRRIALTTKQLIDEAVSLPVEERTLVVDSLLRSLNTPNEDIDRQWAAVAQRRLAELRSGRVKAIPGEEVFAKVQKRFSG